MSYVVISISIHDFIFYVTFFRAGGRFGRKFWIASGVNFGSLGAEIWDRSGRKLLTLIFLQGFT